MKKNEPMNMFTENKGCQTFYYKRTNNIEVKNAKLPAEKTRTEKTNKLCLIVQLVAV